MSGQDRVKQTVRTNLKFYLLLFEVVTSNRSFDLLLYEKEDWELDEMEGESANEDEEDQTVTSLRHSETEPKSCDHQRKSKLKRREAGKCTGIVYPLDLWFLLSCYITPEQVQTFALICQRASTAVSSQKFWMQLYWRHIVNTQSLPERLQPERIESRPGLKNRVIRALFQSYEPLKCRILQSISQQEGPDVLQFMHCSPWWYKQGLLKKHTKVWAFYFRFVQRSDFSLRQLRYLSKEWFDKADFIWANTEEGCSILQVTCMNFLVVPPSVIGQTLTSVFINVSRNMRYNCVKMIFHKHRDDGKYRLSDGITVTLDPVHDYRVMRWWHPCYHHHPDW